MGGWLRRLSLLLVLSLCLGLVLFFGYRLAARPFGQPVTEDGSQKLQRSTTVGQTVVAPFDGLYRAALFLGPRGPVKDGELLLHVRTGPDAAEDLRSSVLNASTIKDNGWVRFEFPPIPDSGGKRYYLYLESHMPEGATLTAFRSRQDRYRDGAYYLDGAPADGDLAFQIYSQPDFLAWLRGLAALLAQDKPALWGVPAFYGVLFIGYIGLLGVALLALAREEPDSGN